MEIKREQIEELFEKVIEDMKNNCYNSERHSERQGFYVGARKVGLIRYFASIRLDSIFKK